VENGENQRRGDALRGLGVLETPDESFRQLVLLNIHTDFAMKAIVVHIPGARP
jgi:hypothetical protein